MIIFLLYAAIVWYFAFKWRRHWLGFAVVAGGLALVWLSSMLIAAIQQWLMRSGTRTLMDAHLFHMLLGLEAAIVGVVGVFFACLPPVSPERPCRRCHYELAGLDDPNPTCPECGLANAATKVREAVCAACGRRTLIRRGRDTCDSCDPRPMP